MMKEASSTLDLEFMESKLYDKLEKEFGFAEAKEFISRPTSELREAITNCVLAKQEAKAEVSKNESYMSAKSVINDFSASLREINKPLDLKIKAASELLNSRTQEEKSKAASGE